MTKATSTDTAGLLPCDLHTHTSFSDDCDVDPVTMLEGAAASGIKTLAVTDHHDPGYPDPEFPFLLDTDTYFRTMADFRDRYRDRMEILIGMEIGIKEGSLKAASDAVNSHPFDMVIGSFHCMRRNDMYRYDFRNSDIAYEISDFYAYMHECLKHFDDFDVIGHFSILDRYIGSIYDYSDVEDEIDGILKLLISRGKGIEINTSSFRYGTPEWLPRRSILKRYRELGGEILTFGSDAHSPEYYRYHFADAVKLASELGFRYYSIFRGRTPSFIPLP